MNDEPPVGAFNASIRWVYGHVLDAVEPWLDERFIAHYTALAASGIGPVGGFTDTIMMVDRASRARITVTIKIMRHPGLDTFGPDGQVRSFYVPSVIACMGTPGDASPVEIAQLLGISAMTAAAAELVSSLRLGLLERSIEDDPAAITAAWDANLERKQDKST